MRVRAMQPADLVDVLPLYGEQVREEGAAMALPYPRPAEDIVTLVSRQLLGALGDNTACAQQGLPPIWVGIVAEAGDKHPRVVGYAWGPITVRPLAAPHRVLQAQVAYVLPLMRRRGVMRAVAHAMWAIAEQAGAEAFEASYLPGSAGGAIWEAAGFRPYRIEAAFVDAEGVALPGAPLAADETAIEEAS